MAIITSMVNILVNDTNFDANWAYPSLNEYTTLSLCMESRQFYSELVIPFEKFGDSPSLYSTCAI